MLLEVAGVLKLDAHVARQLAIATSFAQATWFAGLLRSLTLLRAWAGLCTYPIVRLTHHSGYALLTDMSHFHIARSGVHSFSIHEEMLRTDVMVSELGGGRLRRRFGSNQ